MEWGGFDIDVVPPPPKAAEDGEAGASDLLPEGPVLFYVHRDSAGTIVIPVGQIIDDGLAPITPGDDPEAFAARFTDVILAPGTELTLFRHGRRVGSLSVDAAALPTGPVCRPLPRATGTVTLDDDAGAIEEFLAVRSARAPEDGEPAALETTRSMEVVGDMMAGRMLEEREAPVSGVGQLRQQLQPFPLAGSADPGFTATYLVDDSLGLGRDDTGAALFAVFTPQGQTGYAPAFVGYADYAAGGKAAPRVIDFLDWDGDGNVELLLEVFGTTTSWFRAVGRDDEGWGGIFEDRCDPRTAGLAADTTEDGGNGDGVAARGPAGQQRAPATAAAAPETIPDLDAIPDPTIQLSNPGQTPRVTRDTVPPDTSAAR